MTQLQLVGVETTGGVRTLKLNRPDRLNALNDDLITELINALKAADTDDTVRVIVLTGEGRGFCAGQDLTGVPGVQMISEHIRSTYNVLQQTIYDLHKPMICAVNGVAAGAGAGLALAGEIRLWSHSASLVGVFSNFGLIPDAGTSWLLPRMVGFHRAYELLAFAEKVGADEALRLGLCEHVYPDASFRAEVQAYAERLAARPMHALYLTKQALRSALSAPFDEALEQEAQLQQTASNHWEYREGVGAFLNKRPPRFIRDAQK